MKRKLIELSQESLIMCDNPNCDYVIPYAEELVDKSHLFIDQPCPKCGENLLTKEDNLLHKRLIKFVNFINKWFSWILVFYSNKEVDERKDVIVHVHKGIHIIKDNANE